LGYRDGFFEVELALDLAGWKPALLDGGGWVPVRRAAGLPLLGAQENGLAFAIIRAVFVV